MRYLEAAALSVRALRNRPSFLAVVLATLAISIGASTVMFSVVNAFLFSSLPYEGADQLAMIWRTHAEASEPSDEELPLSPGDFTDLDAGSRSFEQVAGLVSEFGNVTGAGEPSRIHLIAVTGDFFTMMRTKAARGRTLSPEDERPDVAPVVVISHGYWQKQFGSDPAVIGRKMSIGGSECEVVGVLPSGFHFAESLVPADPRLSKPVDVWAPLIIGPEARKRGFRTLLVVGRLKPGISLAAAQEELRAYAAHSAEIYPETDKGYGMKVVALRDQIFGHLRPVLLTLWAATGFILLIASANLATLLLARGATRHREIAVRFALGANRWRIVGEALAESVFLSLAGGLIGLIIAFTGTRLLTALSPHNVFRNYPVTMAASVFWFTLGVSGAAGVLFGLLPALCGSRVDVADGLRSGSHGGMGRSQLAFLLLVVAEICLTTTLLIGAGLSVRSFVGLLRADLGVNPERVLTADLFLPLSRYRDTARKVEFFRELIERIQRLPGVASVGMNYALPFSGADPSNGFSIEERPPLQPGEIQSANLGLVNTDYFKTLDIPLLRGRTFRESDTEGTPLVAIIDERLARQYFGREEPLGRRISIASDKLMTIVGIVGTVKQDAFEETARPYVYLPFQQRCYMFTSLAIKTRSTDPISLMSAVRREVRELDKDLPISNFSTLEDSYRRAIAPQCYSMLLVSLFAGIALVLTQVGIYGVMNFLARQRRREVGVRMALGATPSQVFGLVVRQGLVLSLAGASLGLTIAFFLGKVMAGLVYGISTTDTLVFSLVPVLTLQAAFLAYYRPARALSGVDPNESLRSA
jgi:putative ABC transport system permease protein